MAAMTTVVMAVFIVTVALMLVAAEARVCEPECNDDERCVSLDVRRSHSNDYVCVPVRCLTRGRRGRCRHSSPHFHFNRVTMSCEPQTAGACYSSSNSFVSHENCDLTCSPWYRR
ncbi:uncharacterized protein LOC112557805 [Pomacea canaliculata]|uniref:uncharacterized protein LOC112557805 n=1 Tax=Pomacea canaliculata TaxID=400727 RepID=UPI000D726354|nr:uncharacterized protein LOC112557805 [Pomacea canaliculata]